MSTTLSNKVEKAILAEIDNHCTEFSDWLSWKIDGYFGKSFESDIIDELQDRILDQEDEDEEDQQEASEIICEILSEKVPDVLEEMASDLEGEEEDMANASADSDATAIYTYRAIDYFLNNSRCFDICKEMGLVSSPSDPFGHIVSAVVYALAEVNLASIRSDREDMEEIDPEDIIKNSEMGEFFIKLWDTTQGAK